MSQYFTVLNLDNCHSEVNTCLKGKFGECFSDMDSPASVARLTLALWRPEPDYKRIIAKPYSSLITSTPEPGSRYRDEFEHRHYPEQSLANEFGNGLGQLSPELIDLIYEALDDIVDVTRFAVTCQRFYDIGRRHLEIYVAGTFIESWAGDRIICLGDYARMDDLPPGLLTDGEREFIESKSNFIKSTFEDDDDEDNDEDEDEEGGVYEKLRILQTLNPLWYIHQKKRPYQDCRYLILFWLRLGGWREIHEPQIELEAAHILCKLIEETPGLHVETIEEIYNGGYVLRNLTTKEFIRGDAVRDLWEAPKHEFMREVRFDHALFVRITWSSDASLSLGYHGPIQIHRGKWAGHRFDLCKAETVRNEEGAIGGWKDVSREVLDEVVEVWAGDLGM